MLVLFTVFAMGLFVPVERADAATETNDDDHWITTDAAVTQTHELVIVNLSTPDYEILVDDLVADRDDGRVFEVVMLDLDRAASNSSPRCWPSARTSMPCTLFSTATTAASH